MGKQCPKMSIPGPSLGHSMEQGLVSHLLPRPPQLQEESVPVRIEKVPKKNLPRPPLLHKKGIPTHIGMDSPAKVPATQLTRPFSGPLQLEAHLSGLRGHSAGRVKLPEDGLPRPYWDPKALLPKPCESSSLILVGGN